MPRGTMARLASILLLIAVLVSTAGPAQCRRLHQQPEPLTEQSTGSSTDKTPLIV